MAIRTVTDAIRYVGVDDNTLALFESSVYPALVSIDLKQKTEIWPRHQQFR